MNPEQASTIEPPGAPAQSLAGAGPVPLPAAHETMVALNEALILGSVRQHELTEAAEDLNAQLRAEIAARKTAEDEIRKLNADLERRVKERTAALRDTNVLLVREIDERIKTEMELLNAFRIADEANNAKSEFLARMSHEIRTPMNGIVGMTYLLKQSTLSLKQNSYLDKIDVSAQDLMRIIDDILDFSKVEAGKIKLEDIAFDLDDVLTRLGGHASVQAQRKSLQCKISMPANIPRQLIGDSFRLEKVLANLIGNAVKFTERGEFELTVSAFERSDTQVVLEFKVRDTGIGMNAEQVGQLFKPFSQSDTGASRRFGGAGLGLVLSQRFVQLMGGEMSVKSEPRRGSTFGFTARFRLDPKSKSVGR